MGQQTGIEWCDHTFNPWRGCTKVSPGCAHCYAETLSKRNPQVLGSWGPEGVRVVASESYWKQPLAWNRQAKAAGVRRRVFCASLADVFEDRSELVAPRQRLFHLIGRTPWLDWLILTKRPQNVDRFAVEQQLWYVQDGLPGNVWLGASVEDQRRADDRVPYLLRTRAACRFLSVEPMLGLVDPRQIGMTARGDDYDALYGWWRTYQYKARSSAECSIGLTSHSHFDDGTEVRGVDWVIVGGESGPGARPCRVEWVRAVVRQCQAAGVACFVKQMGSAPGHGPVDGDGDPRCWRCDHYDFGPCPDGVLLCNGCDAAWTRFKDPKGGDPAEWPEDLRVREFPHVSNAERTDP